MEHLQKFMIITNPVINIDTNVNIADKQNTAKRYVDMYTVNAPKHSSLV